MASLIAQPALEVACLYLQELELQVGNRTYRVFAWGLRI